MKRSYQTLTWVSRAFAIACFSFFILPGWLQAEGKISWELTEIDGEKYVAVEQIQKFYGFTQSVREGSAITLEHQRISMKLEIGSTESLINGVKVIFSRLVVERGNSVYLSSVDLAQVLDPMLRLIRNKEQGPYCPFFRSREDEEEATVRSPLLSPAVSRRRRLA